MILWLLIAVAVLIVLLGVVAFFSIKKGGRETDYYALFGMGVVWVPFGVVMMIFEPDFFLGSFFFILGWVYFVIGLVNKDKWKKREAFKSKTKQWLVWLLLGLLALGVLSYFIFR